jgi:hypothetical protein
MCILANHFTTTASYFENQRNGFPMHRDLAMIDWMFQKYVKIVPKSLKNAFLFCYNQIKTLINMAVESHWMAN